MRLLACIIASVVLVVPVLAEPVLQFVGDTATVSGITPAGRAAIFVISQEANRYPARVVRIASIRAPEMDGTLRVPFPIPIPASSIWVVTDLATGESTIAAPTGYKIRQSTLPGSMLRRRTPGTAARLDLDGEEVEIFYVRPGSGAWLAEASLGLDLRSMQPLDDSPAPPDDFATGDLIVVLDPFAMVVRTLRVR